MKMFLFANELDYCDDTRRKLERLVTFLSLFFTPRWMTAPLAADAPLHDLTLMHDMIKYRELDSDIANAILCKMANHKWYLTQEIVPFSLFSSRVPNKLKHDIALKILSVERPEGFRRGKPVFPEINNNTTLADLVGPESYFLFDVLKIGTDWLSQPVETWTNSQEFKSAEKYVTSLKVVNDIAERGVKMISDFANVITTNSEQREMLLQAVEHNRKKYDSFKKACLNK